MTLGSSLVCAVFFYMGGAVAFGQQPAQSQNGVPVVQQSGAPVVQQSGAPVVQQNVPLIQPGAPGKPEKILTEATTAGTGPQGPTDADVKFMQGMIMHHSQAVEMVALMPGRTKNPKMVALGQRISISQSDEIKFMKRWLTYRDKPLTEMGDMAGMGHMDMPLMPGMLTAKQMVALKKASGAKFDQLFLSGMIQHHGGALTMVNDLFDTPSAAQDPQLFDFTADIGVTQQGEIDTMQKMLATEK